MVLRNLSKCKLLLTNGIGYTAVRSKIVLLMLPSDLFHENFQELTFRRYFQFVVNDYKT